MSPRLSRGITKNRLRRHLFEVLFVALSARPHPIHSRKGRGEQQPFFNGLLWARDGKRLDEPHVTLDGDLKWPRRNRNCSWSSSWSPSATGRGNATPVPSRDAFGAICRTVSMAGPSRATSRFREPG